MATTGVFARFAEQGVVVPEVGPVGPYPAGSTKRVSPVADIAVGTNPLDGSRLMPASGERVP